MRLNSKHVIIFVLSAFLLLGLWHYQDTQESALKAKYEREIAIQDSIIQVNNQRIDSLNTVLTDLDAQSDSLKTAAKEIDTKIIYIENQRNEAHSNIDTTGVSDIYKYWAVTLNLYLSL